MEKEKEKLVGMVEEMFEDVLAKMAAQECLDHAMVKVELDASSDGKVGNISLHYEGNSAGYLYGAYILIAEAMKESGIDMDFFLKVIKIIAEHSKNPAGGEKKEEEEDHV